MKNNCYCLLKHKFITQIQFTNCHICVNIIANEMCLTQKMSLSLTHDEIASIDKKELRLKKLNKL